MNLTIITVNYNCAGQTIGLLRSLEQQSDPNFDVIVVDNDSNPEDRAILGEYVSSSPLNLEIIHSPTNRGFSGGNNLAIRKALAQGSTHVALLNPDTTVDSDFIAELPTEEGITALPLREGERIAYAGIACWLCATLPHLYQAHPNRKDVYAIGAGMVIHREVFDHIGFLDERYFLYFEDADFSLRARKAKLPMTFLTSPTITHSLSQSTRRLGNPLLLRYHMRNALLFNKNHGPWWIQIALPGWAIWTMMKQLVKICIVPSRRAQSWAIAFGIIDFYGKRFGQIAQNNGRHRM